MSVHSYVSDARGASSQIVHISTVSSDSAGLWVWALDELATFGRQWRELKAHSAPASPKQAECETAPSANTEIVTIFGKGASVEVITDDDSPRTLS